MSNVRHEVAVRNKIIYQPANKGAGRRVKDRETERGRRGIEKNVCEQEKPRHFIERAKLGLLPLVG